MPIIFVMASSLLGTLLMCLGASFGFEEGINVKNTSIILGGMGWIALSFTVANILQKKWRSETNNKILDNQG